MLAPKYPVKFRSEGNASYSCLKRDMRDADTAGAGVPAASTTVRFASIAGIMSRCREPPLRANSRTFVRKGSITA
jgi:hypothetical protein